MLKTRPSIYDGAFSGNSKLLYLVTIFAKKVSSKMFRWALNALIAWKMSVFVVFPVLIFSHSHWIFSPNAGKYGAEILPIRTLFKQWPLYSFVWCSSLFLFSRFFYTFLNKNTVYKSTKIFKNICSLPNVYEWIKDHAEVYLMVCFNALNFMSLKVSQKD